MSRSAYGHGWCGLCGQRVSSSGWARTAHLRKHVGEGLLMEVPRDYTTTVRFRVEATGDIRSAHQLIGHRPATPNDSIRPNTKPPATD